MTVQFIGLPGEPPLLPGTPPGRQLLTALPLAAFKLVNVGNPEWALLLYGFHRSAERRINAGPKGLMHEAAHDFIVALLPEVRRIYWARGFDVHLTPEAINAVAAELAEEMMNSRRMKEEADAFLEAARTLIAQTPEWVAINPEVFEVTEYESARATINRWIDYIEYMKMISRYEDAIKLHRFVIYCSRMHDAVFQRIN